MSVLFSIRVFTLIRMPDDPNPIEELKHMTDPILLASILESPNESIPVVSL